MIHLNKPECNNKRLKTIQIISTCLPKRRYSKSDYPRLLQSTIDSNERKKRILSYSKLISNLEDEYNQSAQSCSLWKLMDTLSSESVVNVVSLPIFKEDMLYLYKTFKRRQNPHVEKYHDEIRKSSICPYCGKAIGSTEDIVLDHFLPISRFPMFAATPINLIPCCTYCNSSIKKEKLPFIVSVK